MCQALCFSLKSKRLNLHIMPRDVESSDYRRDEGRSRYRDREYKSWRGYDSSGQTRGHERPSRRERESSDRQERDRYGYGEEERERERRRDRERYDRDRDRRGDRSTSPRSSRPRSDSRSRSRSPPVNKAKPNFGASGLLAAETNTVKSVDGKNSTVLKYNEPPEARKPSVGWRLYVFKGDEQVGKLQFCIYIKPTR